VNVDQIKVRNKCTLKMSERHTPCTIKTTIDSGQKGVRHFQFSVYIHINLVYKKNISVTAYPNKSMVAH